MSHLSGYEIEELLGDAKRIDTHIALRREFARTQAVYPRLLRLLSEQRELREQSSERERMFHEEIES